jgi:hypothetical protein
VAEGEVQLLVKSKALPQRFALGVGRGAPRVTAEPLFASIGQDERGLAATEAEQWHLVAAEAPEDRSPWDLCHQLLSEGFGFAGAPDAAFAEPDLEQQFVTGDGRSEALKAAAGCPSTGDPQDRRFPRVESSGEDVPLWFARQEFSQFAIISPDPGPGQIRVAHVDTGYDPGHQTLPAGPARRSAAQLHPGREARQCRRHNERAPDESGARHRDAEHPRREVAWGPRRVSR